MKKTWLVDLKMGLLHSLDIARLYMRRPNNQVAYHNILFSIAIAAKPTVVLELGTGAGVSSLAFIRALQYWNSIRRLQAGVLHTCDINADAIRWLKRFGRFGSLVTPHVMTTDELAARWAERSTPIDLLYIDADHSHKQSLADFEQFAPYVAPDGLVLMHDTFPLTESHEQLQYSGTVWKTATYIKQHYREEFELMTMPFLCGISLLRKKGARYF